MANQEHVKVLEQGVEAWNAWREKNVHVRPDLSGIDITEVGHGYPADFSGANFREADFHNTYFGNANLSGADLDKANFEEARLDGSDLRGTLIADANFRNAHLEGVDLSDANFLTGRINFDGAYLASANLSNALLFNANFKGACLAGASLIDASLEQANLKSSDLQGADLSNARLRSANLFDSSLTNANLSGAYLHQADLRFAKINDKTNFNGAYVEDARIDRYLIEILKECEGLSRADLAKMTIEDDTGDILASFRGIKLWLHIFALFAFLFPYLSFAATRYVEARFFLDTNSDTVPLWKAIARYIWNGGQNWQDDWHFHCSFIAFCILSIYNVCRWLLLSRVSDLEHRQQIIGLPINFRDGEWYFVFWLRRLMGWISVFCLVILLINTGYFLTQEVPVIPR